MQGEKERWLQVCEQVASEQDPSKLLGLVAELDRLLEEKSKRLQMSVRSAKSPDAAPDAG